MPATVGRATERRRLRHGLAAGATPIVVLGPAGIGKSTLVTTALEGLPSVTGAALESLRWNRYLPLAQAVVAPLAGDPEQAAAAVLARVGGRVLVVEDLHWADAGTLDVLTVLARRLRLVVTARTGPGGEPDPAVARALAAMEAVAIELGPLAGRAARALVNRYHPRLAAGAVDDLLTAAGGNPLLLEELPVLGLVSPTLAAALSVRLAACASQSRHELLVLATAGHALAATDVAALLDDPALRGLVHVRDGDVTLRHGALGEGLISGASAADRAAAHRTLADRLADPVACAVHLLAAGHAVAAARRAREALEGEPDPVRRARLLQLIADSGTNASEAARLDAAHALLDVGAWDDAVRTAGLIDDRDRQRRAEGHLVAGLAHWSAGRTDQARAELESVRALVPPTDPVAVRAAVEAANQAGRARPGQEAVTEAERALAAADEAGVEQWRARAVLGQALMFCRRPGWDDHLRAVVHGARVARDETAELSAAFTLVSGLGFVGAMPEAMAISREVLARLADRPFGTWHAHFAGALVMHGLLVGEDRAEVISLSHRLLAERPLFRNRAQVDLALVVALADGGQIDDAEAALRTGWQMARNDEDRSLMVVGEAELGWRAEDGGRVRRAVAQADLLQREFFGVTAVARALAGYAALDDGVLELTRPPAPEVPALAPTAIEYRALKAWSEGDPAGALAGLDAAAEAWAEVHLTRFAARARWAAAEVAMRSGATDGRARARAARSVAVALGLPALVARARRTLDQDALAALPLTAREREVLGLVAAGLTSPAIAGELGIGTATVESHLRSARQKLGARTRWQAATAVAGRRTSSMP